MAYLGNDLQVAFPSYRLIDDISASFNGVLTAFALTIGGASPAPFPINPQQCLISVNGTIQKPDPTGASGFTLTGTNIVFASAPTGGWAFFGVILAGADYVNVGANFPDGQVNAPSITFDQDNDTGFYRSSSGVVSFTSNGVGTATFGSASFTAPSFIPTSSSVPANGVYLPAANSVAIATNGSGRLFVNSTGQVGVANSSPGVALDVTGAIRASTTVSDTAGNVRIIPQNSQSGSYTLAAADLGKHISITTGGVTVPASIFSTGDVVSIYNNSGSNQTITQGGSVTLRQAGTANTGNRTLAQYGIATVLCVSSNTFVISGAGLT